MFEVRFNGLSNKSVQVFTANETEIIFEFDSMIHTMKLLVLIESNIPIQID